MQRRRVAVAATVVIVGLVVALLWYRDRGRSEPAVASGSSSDVLAADVPGTRTPSGPARSSFGQAGVPPRRIAGVVMFEGAPTEATVTLGTEHGGLGPGDLEVRTGTDGRFEFEPQPAVMYVVTAARPGNAPAMEVIDLRDPNTAPESLVLELRGCRHRLSGTVRDSAGGVIAGASVRPKTWFWNGPAVHTDDDGNYEICGPGELLGLEYSAEGYGSLSVQLGFTGDLQYDARLVPEAVISGRVEGSDGTPIPHATVVAHPESWKGTEYPGDASTVAGADGRFELHGVAPGRMLVTARARGWAPSEETIVHTSAATAAADVVVRLTRSAVLRGRAMLDGKPASGVAIAWKPTGEHGPSATAVTQADGIFVLDGFAPGEGTLLAHGFDVLSPGAITLSADRRKDVDVVLQPQASIVGRVTRQGRPTAGARVAAEGRETWITDTRADGSFEILGAPTGHIKVSANSDREGAFAPDQMVWIESGKRYELEFELSGAGRISGVLVATDGTPLAGAQVRASLVGGDDVGSAGTRADGSFTIAALSGGGSYELSVSAPNSSTPLSAAGEFPRVEVADGETRIRDVRLVVRAQRTSIAGVVIDEAGNPVPDARIMAQATTGTGVPYFNEWTRLDRTTTDTEGAFEMAVYGPATYALEANVDGRYGQVGGVAPGTKNVTIVLGPRRQN